ncbi:hypothetical protein [Tepidibacter mesophilus]|uniref:hypothetical protein n=1 Tax=Tepidibacter mesophilus TaxID=655607 RepID=UPI000C08AFFC|nr:hypothetical protein [Tepidibacter mesophilus]
MKFPLCYQRSNYDCFPTTLLNALNYLLPLDKINPELITKITTSSLDVFDEKGESGKGGTSKLAVELISNWLNAYSSHKCFGITSDFIWGREVCIDKIYSCIKKKGVAAVTVYFNSFVHHYVLVTDIDKDFIYLFDPYTYSSTFSEEDIIIMQIPYKMNRKISINRFIQNQEITYSMGNIQKRECLLIYPVTCD